MALYQLMAVTHSAAAHEDEGEGPEGPGGADDPRHSDEQDDAEDVLDGGEVDPQQRPQHGTRLGEKGVSVVNPCILRAIINN